MLYTHVYTCIYIFILIYTAQIHTLITINQCDSTIWHTIFRIKTKRCRRWLYHIFVQKNSPSFFKENLEGKSPASTGHLLKRQFWQSNTAASSWLRDYSIVCYTQTKAKVWFWISSMLYGRNKTPIRFSIISKVKRNTGAKWKAKKCLILLCIP